MTTRIISFILAATFLLSTLAFSGFVIFEASQEDDLQAQQAELQRQLEEQQQEALTTQENQEVRLLDDFTPLTDRIAELQITDTVEGSGDAVVAGANVTVHYTGATVRDGEIFESSRDGGEPISFNLDGLIEGWQEGIPGMQVGGTRRLVIPAAQAYGDDENTGRPFGDLVFDIELISIN